MKRVRLQKKNYVMGDSFGSVNIYVENIESEGFRGIKLSNYNLKKYVINIRFPDYTNIKVKIVQHIVWNSAGDENFEVAYSNFDGDKITERNISYVDNNAYSCKKYDLYILFAVIDKDKDGYNNYMTTTIYENRYFISTDELVPRGGTTGQMLVKKSNANNDVTWLNPPKIPTKVSELTNDSKFLTAIPSEYITQAKLDTMFSFNESGELVVTINGVTKIFTPKA